METLNFKQVVNFKKGESYSVCLRGARRYSKGADFDLYLYSKNAEKPEIGNIVSQKQFRFCDLNDSHCSDNYDIKAKTINGLTDAMNNCYDDFELNEIVTLLRFDVV